MNVNTTEANHNTSDEFGLNKLTIGELKNELRARNLPVGGSKGVLLTRLMEALNDEVAQDDNLLEE